METGARPLGLGWGLGQSPEGPWLAAFAAALSLRELENQLRVGYRGRWDRR